MIGIMFNIRLKQYLRNLKKPLDLIGFVLAFIFIALYGLGVGFLLVQGGKGELEEFSPEWFRNIVLGLAVFMTFMRMFKPTYLPMRRTLLKYQPISPVQRYLFSIASDFQNVYFFFWLIFLMGVVITSGLEGLLLSFSVIFVVIVAHFLRRTVQYFIDFHQKKRSYFVLGAVILFTALCSLLFNTLWFLPSLLFLSLILFGAGFYLEVNTIEKKKLAKKESNRSWAIKTLMNNRNVRTPMLVGLFLKLFFLGIDIFLFTNYNEHVLDGKGLYWLFISSATVFTYVFNNVWGFWRSAWLNLELGPDSLKGMFQFFWSTIKYPLLLDFIVTFALVFFVQPDYLFVILFYFTSLITMVASAFLWSILFPKLVNHFMPKKGSTSYWSVFSVFGIVLSLSLISKGGWPLVLVPLFLILAGICIVIAIKIYPEKKYAIFSKLFRSE
jgi:hypothetical protein